MLTRRRRGGAGPSKLGAAALSEDALCALDGVFAAAIYDEVTGKFVVARDTFGVRPLFSGKIQLSETASLRLFASEMKHLYECDPTTIDQFRPGSFVVYSRETRSFAYERREQFRAGVPCPLSNTPPTLSVTMAWVRNALEDAVLEGRRLGCRLGAASE